MSSGLDSFLWTQTVTQIPQDLVFHNLRIRSWDRHLQDCPRMFVIMIHIEVVQKTWPFHWAYFGSVVSVLRGRESTCCVLSLSSCLPPTDDRIKTPIPSFRMPPQVWSCRVSLQILHFSSLHECTRNTWALASNTLPRMQGVLGRVLCWVCCVETRLPKVFQPNFSATLLTMPSEGYLLNLTH